jgi:hypothetical protein
MIIANITEMLNHKPDTEYDHKGHRWLNEQLNCGCIVAICLDVEPAEQDRKFAIKQFNKNWVCTSRKKYYRGQFLHTSPVPV